MFDAFLDDRSTRTGEPFVAFNAEADHDSYVDGKPGFDGARSFLESRHIGLPAGAPGDPSSVIAGFAGMRDRVVTLSFKPRLPDGLTRLAIAISVRRRRLRVEITPGTTTYRLLDGAPLPIVHAGEPASVSTGDHSSPPAKPSITDPEPSQSYGREPLRRRARDRSSHEAREAG